MASVKDSYGCEEHRRKKSNRKNADESAKKHKSHEDNLNVQINCLFCGSGSKKSQEQNFSAMINKALYTKYSSSQNYYYTKDINDIIAESRTAAVILFKDLLHSDEEEEYLKRFYHFSEYNFKIKMLTEYYKFHNDIPRIFIMSVIQIVNRYHDKKRKLEYIRVTKMLKEEQEGQNMPKPSEEKKEAKDFIITDRILDDLSLTDPEQKHLEGNSNIPKSSQPNLAKPSNQDNKETTKRLLQGYNVPVNKGNGLNKFIEKNKDGIINQSSASNTLHDLNIKLGEIISNSRSYNLELNYLEINDWHQNETLTNLSNFLHFLNKNPEKNVHQTVSLHAGTPQKKQVVQNSAKKKQIMPQTEVIPKPISSLVKTISPSSSQSASNFLKSSEKVKIKLDEMNKNLAISKTSNSQIEKQKDTLSITKIKNFEEALKITSNRHQQKISIQTSLPRENLQEKITSVNSSKNINRINLSRTPSKQIENRSHETSLTSRQRYPPSSSKSSRPTSRTKTRSSDMYTKALDLLLGTNQIMLGNNGHKQELTQAHRSTKSSLNFKTKTSSQNIISQNEKSIGKEDLKIDLGLKCMSNKIKSNKVITSFHNLHTEREIKKMGTLGNLDLQKKDFKQPPYTEREFPRDFFYKEKESDRNHMKTLKAFIPLPNESDVIKSCLNSNRDKKKIGFHKYTKSEGRAKKTESNEKIEIINDVKILLNGTGKNKANGSSPQRNAYEQSQHNILNLFAQPSFEKKNERISTLKSDRQPCHDEVFYADTDIIAKVFKSKSPNSEVLNKFNKRISKKINMINNDIDCKMLDFSPLRMKPKETPTVHQVRVIHDKSPPSLNASSQRRIAAKNDFEMLRRDLRFENFEIHSRSKEKI